MKKQKWLSAFLSLLMVGEMTLPSALAQENNLLFQEEDSGITLYSEEENTLPTENWIDFAVEPQQDGEGVYQITSGEELA